jgi:hypothetical protein
MTMDISNCLFPPTSEYPRGPDSYRDAQLLIAETLAPICG